MVGVRPPPLIVTLVGCGTTMSEPAIDGPTTVIVSGPFVNVIFHGWAIRLALNNIALLQKLAFVEIGPHRAGGSVKPLGGYVALTVAPVDPPTTFPPY